MFTEYAAIFFITLLMITVIIKTAGRIGLIDIPNERSVHVHAVPRGAGIGIIIGVLSAVALFQNELITAYPLSFLGIAAVFIVGILDDHRDTAPKTKFIVLAAATILLYLDGLQFHTFKDFLGVEVALHHWLVLPFMMFATVGFTNAFNLIDGLDGLSGILGIIIFSCFFYIGYTHDDQLVTTLSSFFITALAAFLIFNWNPAKIFMGDSGSLTIGFVIALLSIKVSAYIQPIAILFLAAIPIFDTLVVMIRRKRNGYSMFRPDKKHIHHIALKFFEYNVRKSVLFLAAIQLIYSMAGVNLSTHSEQAYALLLFFINLFVLYIGLNGILRRQTLLELKLHRKNRN